MRGEEEVKCKTNQEYSERTSPRRESVTEIKICDLEEVTRSGIGSLSIWSKVMVKAERDPSMASTNSKPVFNTSQQKSVSDEVERLHKRRASKVSYKFSHLMRKQMREFADPPAPSSWHSSTQTWGPSSGASGPIPMGYRE